MLIGLIIGLIIGMIAGVMISALCIAASRNETESEILESEVYKNIEEGSV